MSNSNDLPPPPAGPAPDDPPPSSLPEYQAPPGTAMRSYSGPQAVATAPAGGGQLGGMLPAGDAGNNTEDLFRLLLLIWHHKILVLCLTLVSALTGFLLSQRATPVFQSQARLSVVYRAQPRNQDWDTGISDVEYQRNFESILREAISRNVMLDAAGKIKDKENIPSMRDLAREDIADLLASGANITADSKTNHVVYTFNTVNKDEAPVALGYLVQAFKDNQLKSQLLEIGGVATQVTIDEAVKHREYDTALSAFNDYCLENRIDLSDNTAVRFETQKQDLKQRLSTASDEVAQKQGMLSLVDPADSASLLTWALTQQGISYTLQQMKTEEDKLNNRLNERRQIYSDDDPENQRQLAAIAAKHQEIMDTAKAYYNAQAKDLDGANAATARLQAAIDDLQKNMDVQLPLLAKAKTLREQVDLAKQAWEALAARKIEASNTSAKRFTSIKAVEPITPPEKVYPRISVFVTLGTLGGLILSIVIVLFWARIDDTLKTSVQVPRELGIPTLGTVLFSPAIGPDPSGLPLVARMPRSPEAEALFIVWANIATRLNLSPGACKVLMLTSSIPEEGKSTTSANLASVAAQQNLRVLLIDLDLRRPSLHSYFGVTNAVGCIQALNRHMRREQCIQRTAVKNLDILTTGLGEDHPNELVSPQNLMGLLAWARGNYDLVVLDTPPLLLAADGLIVSRFIDGAVLVIHGGQTPLDTVQRSRDMLLGANTNLIGAILNDRTGAVDDRDRSYYYKYSSYYHQSANE